jgi:NADH-quinone oxidoreductase subunit J
MAAAVVLFYAGAILVTYVFVIMLAAEAAPAVETTSSGHGTGALATLAEHDAISREPVAACAVGFTLMGVLLFLVFDKAQGIHSTAGVVTVVTTSSIALSGPIQQLGDFLFRRHLVNLELAGLILTVSMVGAIVIARKRVVSELTSATTEAGDVILGPATPVTDDPHSIPVVGTTNPRQKEYPET